jgi:opacity protein-like surface antigen
VDKFDTNQFQISAGIGYAPTLWMNIRLGYEFNKYDSSGGGSSDSSNYTENRGLLTITLQPDQPWRF